MKAILVKFIGPSNFKGSRLKAIEPDGKSVTISYPHELNRDGAYRLAARLLIEKMGWDTLKVDLVQGSLKDAEVFVMVENRE